MAVKNITTLKTDTNNTITTNGARAITGALHNALLQDILDSCVNRISDVSILGLFDFSSSQTYKEGQAVIYNDGGGDQIYRANKDNGPAAFNALDFDALSSTDTNIANTDLVLTGNRTLTGSHTLIFNTDASSLQFKNQGHGMDVVTTAVVLTNSAASTRIVLGTAGTGIVITDTLGGLGLKYNNRAVDEANIVWGTDLDHIPSIGAISEHIGLQDVNALVTTPTATEDGYAIVWDNTAGEYQLQSAGTAISGTDNYVPIFNATGDNVEDSALRILDINPTTNRKHSVYWEGLSSGSDPSDTTTFEIVGSDTGLENLGIRSIYDALNVPSGLPIAQQRTLVNSSSYFNMYDGRWDFNDNVEELGEFVLSNERLFSVARIKTGGNSGLKRAIVHPNTLFWGQTSQNAQWLGFVMSGEEGWAHIGPEFYNVTSNAILRINNSTNFGFVDRPHILLNGGFNEGTTTPSNGSIWLSSNDSKVYLRNNNSVNIPLDGLKSVISNSQASTATLTPDANSEDIEVVTALAGALTIAAPTGTPVEGQKLVIKIKDDGTSRALTWDAIFQVIGTTLPTATTISKWHRIECEYNVTDTKWDVIDVKEQA